MEDQKINLTEETEERGLVVAQELNGQMFSNDSKVRKATSLDLDDEEQMDMLLASMDEVDEKLNAEIGKELEVIGYYAQEIPTKFIDEETGEEIERKKHTLTLFTSDGKSHVTGSNACFYSFGNIIAIKGNPTKERPLILMPVEVPAKTKGHTYLKLKFVKKEK